MPAYITISGFDEFIAKCEQAPEIMNKNMDKAAKFAAKSWESGAVRDAPKDIGDLIRGIKSFSEVPGVWNIVSESAHSPYMEWGTKSKVYVPSDLQEYASQFMGAGAVLGFSAKSLIFAWCKRKGIDPKLWFPIYRSIMINGVTPHPFFFDQRPFVEQQLIGDLEQLLEIK